MTPYYDRPGVKIYLGDCLDVMRGMPDNSVDTVLTDPPYGLSFMGKNWDHGIPGVAYWREALRVAKPGATLKAFGGTRTYHRLACAIEDAGWEIRDCVTYFHDGTQQEAALMASLDEEQLAAYLELHYPNQQLHWTFGSGFPKSLDIGKSLDKRAGAERKVVGNRWEHKYPNGPGGTGFHGGPGKYTQIGRGHEFITVPATPLATKWDGWKSHGLKPAFEPIIIAMAPMPGGYAENAERFGLAGLWIDGVRVETNGESLGRESPGIRSMSNNALKQGARPNSYYKDQDKRFIDNSGTKGRYPANVILSGEPGVEAEFAKAGVRTSNGGKGPHRIQATDKRNDNRSAYGDFGATNDFVFGDTGSASRYFQHCPPDPNCLTCTDCLTDPPPPITDHPEAARLKYCAKAGPKERATPGNNHPTQKPLELVKYLARLTKTPTGGVVLDPFAGSGTTGIACLAEGRECILIEKEPPYAEIARRRIAEYTGEEIAPKEISTKKDEAQQLPLW